MASVDETPVGPGWGVLESEASPTREQTLSYGDRAPGQAQDCSRSVQGGVPEHGSLSPLSPATYPGCLQRGGRPSQARRGGSPSVGALSGSGGPPEKGTWLTPGGSHPGLLPGVPAGSCVGGTCWGAHPLEPGCRLHRASTCHPEVGDGERAQGASLSVGSGGAPGSSWAVGQGTGAPTRDRRAVVLAIQHFQNVIALSSCFHYFC